jgi:hypothetical protein
MNLLDILIALPAIGFVVTLLLPRPQEQLIRLVTLILIPKSTITSASTA